MTDFYDVPIASDASVLAQDAKDQLTSVWVGWEPNDGDMEVVLIEALAPMAQNALEVAAQVPAGAFRAYGTKLIGEPYQAAVAATGQVTFTAIDNAGYESDDLVQLAQGSQAFMTDIPVVIPAGSTSVTVDVTALTPGEAGNDLTGDLDLVTALPWVDSTVFVGSTADGIDAEEDDAYQDRLARKLQLSAYTLVTGRDFELLALDQPNIGRAMAIVGTARAVTVAVANVSGNTVSSADKAALVALYGDYRQVNTTYTVVDPTYTTVGVTFTVKAYPNIDVTDLKARCEAAVAAWLNKATWGNPGRGTSEQWLNTTIVRVDKVLDVLADVDGVDYVVRSSVLINGSNADLTLSGTAPLPNTGTITCTVT